MSKGSKIKWTNDTWQVMTGCTKFSLGCVNCYAEAFAPNLKRMGMANYQNGFDGFEVTCHPGELQKPLQERKPRKYFVCSMGDLFHDEVPLEYLLQVFAVMGKASQHTFQLLTKRAERLAELSPLLPWHKNIWCGVTIEADQYTYRADLLRTTGARLKFVSLEPLLSPLPSLDYSGLGWVIVGGESGRKARPMQESWAADIRDNALLKGIPFFFKQMGGSDKAKGGDLLQGQAWKQFP